MNVIFIIFILVFLFSLYFLYALLFLIFNFPLFLGAPFVPAPSKKVKDTLELADPKPGEILYDLGSGNGQIIIEAAKNYGVKAVGIEINPILVRLSERKIKKLGLENKAKVYKNNFFNADISEADIVVTYLLQTTNNRLEKKLLSELKPGARIVSLSFTFKNIPLIKSKENVRLYQIPITKKYQFLEHKADLKIKAFGATKEELFRNMLLGMQDSQKPEVAGIETVKREIKVNSADFPALLVDFLSEVLYLNQTNKEIYNKINFKKFTDNEIEIELTGKKVERFGEDIKAVTHHDLDIHRKEDKEWEATVLFDI